MGSIPIARKFSILKTHLNDPYETDRREADGLKLFDSKLGRLLPVTYMKDKGARIGQWVRMHPVFVLLVMVLGTAAVVYYPFLFQNQIFIYNDIGSDTQNVYYPFFASLLRKLSNGDFSMMDFTHGLGTSILSRPADSASLFTYLQFLLGASGLKYALVYVHILKIVLAAYVCYLFLDNFDFSKLAKVIAAYAYAFNGFTVLWGQHYFFAAASLYIVLVLLGVEKTIQGRKGIPLL